MNNEYIIINKTAIEKRIEELKNKLSDEKDCEDPLEYLLGEFQGEVKGLKQILSQSTPLIPEIEKTWETCSKLKSGQNVGIRNKTEYISNLKLDI